MPPRFFYDGRFIEAIALGHTHVEPDRAFALTGALYAALGLTIDPALPAAFGALVAGAAVAAPLVRRRTVALGSIALAVASLGLMAIFLAWYTKETFAIVAISMTILLLRWSRSLPVALLPIATYGLLLRPYWLLIAGVALGLFIVERYRPVRWWRLLGLVLAFLFMASVGYHLLFDAPLQSIRLTVNAGRSAEDTASIITSLVPPDGILMDVAGTVAILVFLVVPVPLFLTGQVTHTVYGVAILAMWMALFLAASRLRGPRPTPIERHTRRTSPAAEANGDRTTALQCVYLLLAFVAVLAIFEPDFGSYLRHICAVLPLIALMTCSLSPPKPHTSGHAAREQRSRPRR